ncbi:MAG: hypothetical protein JWO30_2214 [Fibrobacteres bacterium]|nr:hypothetical protein [Fibrobacterota bacterium]
MMKTVRSARIRFLSVLAMLLIPPAVRARALGDGPGIPRERYDSSELFKALSTFHSPEGTSWGNGAFYRGYLLLGIDVDEDSAGFQFWDVSDPRKPKLVAQKYDEESKRLREIQNFSFARGYGRDLAAIPSHEGVEIWDFTDIQAPHRYGSADLAHGGGKAIYNGIISAFWQPPYIYCGGMDGGLYVVDARDPRAPHLVKNVPNSALNGRLAGPMFAVGNLLVATTMEFAYESCAITTFDISDPADPQIIDRYSCATHEGSYTAFMNGNRIYGLGAQGRLLAFEISSSFEVNKRGQDTAWADHGGYGMYQDGYVHAGMSDWYIKYDVRGYNPTQVGRFHVNGDNDWAMPIGNLVFVGDDDGPTSEGSLAPHQAGPDTLGPVVNWSQPVDEAVNIPVTSRVGLSFTDNIEFASVDSNSVVVRPAGGAPLPGKLSVLEAIVNFTPDRPFEPRADYEIFLPAGRLRDWGGTPSPRDTVIRFTTETASSLQARRGRARAGGDYRLLRPAQGLGIGRGEGSRLRNPLGRALFPPDAGDPARIRLAPGLYILPVVR